MKRLSTKYLLTNTLFILGLIINTTISAHLVSLKSNTLSPPSFLKKSTDTPDIQLVLEEKILGLFRYEDGLGAVTELTTRYPHSKILIMINGNQHSGKTKLVRKQLYTKNLADYHPALIDEDTYQMDFNSYQGNAPKMYQLIQTLFVSHRIIIYDGINSFKVFRLIRKKLLAAQGKAGFIAINLTVERNRHKPNLYISIFKAKAIPKLLSSPTETKDLKRYTLEKAA